MNGKVYVTTLLDAKKYHRKELAEHYAKLWLIELDIRSIKTHMKIDMLRCKSAELVQKRDRRFFISLQSYSSQYCPCC